MENLTKRVIDDDLSHSPSSEEVYRSLSHKNILVTYVTVNSKRRNYCCFFLTFKHYGIVRLWLVFSVVSIP